MSDKNDNIEVPVILSPFGGLPVNEDVMGDRKQEELAENAEERLKQDEELVKLIEEEGFYEIYAEQEGEYLVEGALLTCSLATKKPLIIQEETYESGMKATGSILERPEAVSKLKVNPKKSGFNGYIPANIYDSKKSKNICPFGNCMSMLTSKDVSIIREMGESAKRTGICQCLMNLNEEWENLPSINEADLFEFPGEEDKEKPYGITRTSILFCKRGGIISALTSGQSVFADENIWESYEKDIFNKFYSELAYENWSDEKKKCAEELWNNLYVRGNYDPFFVAGLIGNIFGEGSCGTLQNGKWSIYVDENNQALCAGINKISNIYQARVACDTENPLGVGMAQWSQSARKERLLANYELAKASDGSLSAEQLIWAECQTMKEELECEDASVGGYKRLVVFPYEKIEPSISDVGDKISFSTCLIYKRYEAAQYSSIVIGDNYAIKVNGLWEQAKQSTNIMGEQSSICARIVAAKVAYEEFME